MEKFELNCKDSNPFGVFDKLSMKLSIGKEYCFKIRKKSRFVGVLEIDDALFRTCCSAMLPEGQDPVDRKKSGTIERTGIGLAARCLTYLKETYQSDAERGGKAFLITGHTDTSGSDQYNDILSAHRAHNVYSVIAGKRDEFKETAHAPHLKTKEEKLKYQKEDHLQIADWAAEEFNWPCSFDANGKNYDKTIRKFQESYNASGFGNGQDPQTIPVDGDWGLLTWGAVFDCYQQTLAKNLSIAISELDQYRESIDLKNRSLFPDVPWVGCGEYHPAEAKGVDNFRSQTNRRVEVYFLDVKKDAETGNSESPDLLCKDGGCAKQECDLYKDTLYPVQPIPPVPVPDDDDDDDVEPWDGIPAVILYPALLTPAVVSDNDDKAFELLLAATVGHPVTAEAVNRQLKFLTEFDSVKEDSGSAQQLFSSDFESHITITELGSGTDEIKKTSSQFGGIVDTRAAGELRNNGYIQYFAVRITGYPFSASGDRSLFNCVWEVRNLEGNPKSTFLEPQDAIVDIVLRSMNGDGLPFDGRHCLQVDAEDVNTTVERKTSQGGSDSIVSYHPLIYIPQGNRPLNIGQIGDVHVTARHQILSKSDARVIDYDCNESNSLTAPSDDPSPVIGGLVNVATRNLKELLDKMGNDSGIDMVVICGDMIDYIQNCFLEAEDEVGTAGEVWRKVNLTGDDYETTYRKFIDNIIVYSLIVNFYAMYRKPVFAITGNHDAYEKPYAISPRVLTEGDLKRANEGIPADTNLTLYEALVLFGRSYHEYKPGLIGSMVRSNLKPDLYKWFYTVFTPFSDFMVNLSHHVLVGLAWGNEEDMIDWPFFTTHGMGHLPRADMSINDKQLSLVNESKSFNKKVILATHFTFVSYIENISMNQGADTEGNVQWVDLDTHLDGTSLNDMGTFHSHREEIYRNDFTSIGGLIYCTLSGHSHRRGFYVITERDESEEAVKTLYYDFPEINNINRATRPIIIVTDSAGNLPRYNRNNEFKPWGSDFASGTKVCFNSDGFINHLEAIKVGPAPRLVVALDYFDLILNERTWYEEIPIIGLPLNLLFGDSNRVTEPFGTRVIELFQSDEVRMDLEDSGNADIPFTIRLSRFFRNMIGIDAVSLFAFVNHSWIRIDLRLQGGRWVINRGADARNFRSAFFQNTSRSRFISIRFRNLNTHPEIAHYDFSSRWNYEINVDEDESGGFLGIGDTHRRYQIFRESRNAEFPDFDFRDRFVKYR